LEAQQHRADLKKSRDDIIANRVKLAKARVRARLGLPPEEEKPKEDENLYDVTDKKKAKEEEAAKKKAEIEKQKERERQKHVRPWDKNKLSSKKRQSSSSSESEDEDEWKPHQERHVMSQGEVFSTARLELFDKHLWFFFFVLQMSGTRNRDWNVSKSLHRLESTL
jgi:hypothetical protein